MLQSLCQLVGAWGEFIATMNVFKASYYVVFMHSLHKSSYSLKIAMTAPVEGYRNYVVVICQIKVYAPWAYTLCLKIKVFHSVRNNYSSAGFMLV